MYDYCGNAKNWKRSEVIAWDTAELYSSQTTQSDSKDNTRNITVENSYTSSNNMAFDKFKRELGTK